jgi:hypothetical protein
MDIISIEYEIALSKIDNVFESAVDAYIDDSDYAYTITESASDIDTLEYLMTEATNKFIEKTNKVFDAIIEVNSKFINDAKRTVKTKTKQKKINKAVKKIEKLSISGIQPKYDKNGEPINRYKQNDSEKELYKEDKEAIKKTMKAYKKYLDKYIKLSYKILYAKTDEEISKISKLLDDENKIYMAELDENVETCIHKYAWVGGKDGVEYDKASIELYGNLEIIENLVNKKIGTLKAMASKAIDDNGEPNLKKVALLKKTSNNMTTATKKVVKAVSTI